MPTKTKGFDIYKGDALNILGTLPGDAIDALITDPPYSSGGMFRADRVNHTTEQKYTTSNKISSFASFPGDNRDQRSFQLWMTLWLIECYRVLKEGAPICIFTDWRQLPVMSDVLQAGGFSWRGIVVWDKKNARPVKGKFRQNTEFVLWGSKGSMPAQVDDYLPGLFRCAVTKGGRFHQTGKPVDLMQALVGIVRQGGTVLDPFMGSGSTGVAALATGRKFVGIEYTDNYFSVAEQRLSNVRMT